MAKTKRSTVGSVCKSKHKDKPDYIKFRDGDNYRYFQLESKKYQLEQLEEGIRENRVHGELADKIRERIMKMPDWVRFDLVEYISKDESGN